MMMNENEVLRIGRELTLEGRSDPFAAAMLATRVPMLITDPRQHDNPVVFVNDAFLQLTHYTREEVLGRNCRFLQGAATDPIAVAQIRNAVSTNEAIEVELLNYRKDGTTFWNRVRISPVFDGEELIFFFASQLDVSPGRLEVQRLTLEQDLLQAELQRRIVDLVASEDRLKFTLKAAGLGTWTLDLENHRLISSAICKENFGRHPNDAFTYEDLQRAILADDFPHWKATIERALASDGVLEVQYRVRTPSNEIRWIEVRAQTSFAGDGRPIAMSGISRDITAQKQLEQHRSLLMDEMVHRIKNTLANVQGIVRQSLRGGHTPQEAEQIIAERLTALGGAQELLLSEKFGPVSIAALMAECVAPFSAYRQRMRWSGSEELRVLPAVASAMALAFHELTTNAIKHGALSNDVGVVEVWWEARDGTFHLVWSEYGGPPVKAPSRRGFGSRLIMQGLTNALGGAVDVDYRSTGLQLVLHAPVNKLLAA